MFFHDFDAGAAFYYGLLSHYLTSLTGGGAMVWLIVMLLIPVLVVALLFFSMAEDFWQLIRLQLGLSRIFGDLIHVFFILLFGFVAEGFSIFMLLKDVF